jgi:hypothetical protein
MVKPQFINILTEAFLKQRYLEEGQSTISIAREIDVDDTTVCNYLRRFHIPIRTRSESRCTLVDYTGFNDLATDWHAYWTGFLAADGCVFEEEKKNTTRIQVHLQASDADHLRNLQAGLKTSVTVRVHSKGPYPSAVIAIFDARFIEALAQWGIVANKTLTMPWPAHFPSALIPAYIRGYFDGDGTIYQRHRSRASSTWTETVCRFISGSFPFLESLQQELQTRGIVTRVISRNQQSNAFVLPLSSRRENLLVFADLLYHDCTVCLERKRTIFREMEDYHAAHPRTGSHLRYQAG